MAHRLSGALWGWHGAIRQGGWAVEKMTVSLRIENAYELYDNETTYVVDQVVDAPPVDYDYEQLREWAEEELLPFTGVGHFDGDSWYDVTVTACSDPLLVGETFEFGY